MIKGLIKAFWAGVPITLAIVLVVFLLVNSIGLPQLPEWSWWVCRGGMAVVFTIIWGIIRMDGEGW